MLQGTHEAPHINWVVGTKQVLKDIVSYQFSYYSLYTNIGRHAIAHLRKHALWKRNMTVMNQVISLCVGECTRHYAVRDRTESLSYFLSLLQHKLWN